MGPFMKDQGHSDQHFSPLLFSLKIWVLESLSGNRHTIGFWTRTEKELILCLNLPINRGHQIHQFWHKAKLFLYGVGQKEADEIVEGKCFKNIFELLEGLRETDVINEIMMFMKQSSLSDFDNEIQSLSQTSRNLLKHSSNWLLVLPRAIFSRVELAIIR